MRIPRSNYDDNVYPSWISVVDSSGRPLKPIIRCKCGEFCGIGLHHVHVDGKVTASFLHAGETVRNPCGWHEHLELIDWIGLDFPPEK